MTHSRTSRSISRLAVGLMAFAAIAGAGFAYMGYSLSRANPELFAPGVVSRGPELASELARPSVQTYLSEFIPQQKWATCGPASLRNALQSFGQKVESEESLFEQSPFAWWRTLATGMTLDELGALAESNFDGQVEIVRPESLNAFRGFLGEANAPGTRVIANFNREPLYGVDIGHFSPIGGYDGQSGSATILDVTESYGFTVVPAELLYDGVSAIDSASGKTRGLLILRKGLPRLPLNDQGASAAGHGEQSEGQ